MKSIFEVKRLSKRYKLGVFNAKTLREEAEAFLARFARKKLKSGNAGDVPQIVKTGGSRLGSK